MNPRKALLISIAATMMIVFIACGSTAAEPTAVLLATATTVPTPLPQISIITADPGLEFELFLEQLPPDDAVCLETSIGMRRLTELASGADSLQSEQDVLASCFSNEMVAGFMAGQIQRSLGTFGGSSMACVVSLLGDIPKGTLSELMIGADEPQSEGTRLATEGFVECLTQAELTALGGLDQGGSNIGGRSSDGHVSRNEECMVGELGESFASGYGGVLSGELVEGFASAAEHCGISFSFASLVAGLEDTERKYKIAELEAIGFKKDDTYDIEGLEGASSAHYGFYGVDPYARLEYEARFYFSHDAAREIGVEFANEATGADTSLYRDDQRWQEGLSDRRRCDSSGGHHVGRCGFPKYFDYVVVGNMVLMCQGKDTLESLEACADLLDVLQ